MKKLMILLVLSVFTVTVFAQDIIIKRDATKIEAVITEVTSSEVRYKSFSNLEGPTFILSTDEIVTIMYKNGEVQVFEKKANVQQQYGNASYENNGAKLAYAGDYFYLGDKVMTTREGSNFLKRNCMTAYQYFNVYTKLGYSGVAFMTLGAALIITGGILFATYHEYSGFSTMMAGAASMVFGSPLCAAGFACRGNACYIYNNSCANTAYNRKKGVTLDLRSSRDGIGLALRF